MLLERLADRAHEFRVAAKMREQSFDIELPQLLAAVAGQLFKCGVCPAYNVVEPGNCERGRRACGNGA